MYNAQDKIPPLEFNTYDFKGRTDKILKIAFIADFHDRTYSRILRSFDREKPDIICIAGDLIMWHNIRRSDLTLRKYFNMILKKEILTEECGHLYSSVFSLEFLRKCASSAPTFYSLGNHEKYFDSLDRETAEAAGAVLLDNNYVVHDGIAIGGLTSAYVSNMTEPYAGRDGKKRVSTIPSDTGLTEKSLSWLDEFSSRKEFRLLLCHHPEYYDKYLADRDADLILAGHAHGGQIRIGDRGLYAPGQGFFPEYVSGLYHDRMIVSRGIANVSRNIPRINNIREVIYINLIPE